MTDPACLVGTGQIYNYSSLRAWLCTGARTCPRTNLPLVDVEVRGREADQGSASAVLAVPDAWGGAPLFGRQPGGL